MNSKPWFLGAVLCSTACLLGPVALHAATAPIFNAPKLSGAGLQPEAIATGDFNGDGKPDVVLGGFSDVSILLSSPGGTYQPARNLGLGGPIPTSIAVGDFDADGKLDLAVNYSGNSNHSVVVLLGNGDGTFKAPTTYPAGSNVQSIAVGDFNRDGKLDLVAANEGTSAADASITVLLGNGDGTFQNGLTYAAPVQPLYVLVGDWNGDGKPDLAVSNFNAFTVSIWLGNGDGSFAAPVNYTLAGLAGDLAAGDFNNDGKPDLAILTATPQTGTDNRDNTVSILLSKGDGSFQKPLVHLLGSSPLSHLTIGDFNGDGKLDVAGSNVNTGFVSVMIGKGNGSLQTGTKFQAGACPEGLRASDLTGDGKADIVVADSCSSSVAFLMGDGAGHFGPQPKKYTVGIGQLAIAQTDFNHDGKPDLVISNANSNSISILIGQGRSTFNTPVTYSAGMIPMAVAVGDFNGDGHPDVAVADQGSGNRGTVQIFLGKGDGSFQASVSYAAGASPSGIAVGDFNGDGKSDLALTEYGGKIAILLGVGDGTFQPVKTYTAGGEFVGIGVGDFNADGKLDIVTIGNTLKGSLTDAVFILLGNGDGTFAKPAHYNVGTHALSVSIRDLNGDGKLDLAVADYASNDVAVLIGNGDGTFAKAVFYPTAEQPESVVVADFNGDGALDLAIANNASNTVSILMGNGDGTFVAAPWQFAVAAPQAMTSADFNGDGKPDLAIAASPGIGLANTAGQVDILLNRTR